MPSFQCQVCGTQFDVPQAAIDKYPGWQPKYCRDHSPQSKKTQSSKSKSGKSKKPVGGGAKREENLTREKVLAKYTAGPDSGVFTDGSASPNPGPGGWGMVWVEKGEIQAERHGRDPDTTNNRMELMALIEAFKVLPEDAEVEIRSDSKLCVNTINQWAASWARNGWKRKTGPIKNLDLVKELYALSLSHPKCKVAWIAAHTGYRWNEYADSLATAWMRREV